MKSVNLKVTLEVVEPINDNYEDIAKYVNEALLDRLSAEYDANQLENYKMLVEVIEEVPY